MLQLAENHCLDEQLWGELFAASLDEGLTVKLLANAPTVTLARNILTEPSDSLRILTLTQGVKQIDEQLILDLIAAPFFNTEYIRAIFRSKQPLPEHLSRTLWSIFFNETVTLPAPIDQSLLADLDIFLSYSAVPTDEELLMVFFSENRTQNSWDYLSKAIDYRPSLTETMATAPERTWYCRELAMSRHITSEIAEKLLAHALKLPVADADAKAILADLATNPWIDYNIRLTTIDTYIQRCNPPSAPNESEDSAVDEFGEYGPSWRGLRKSIQRAIDNATPPLPVEIDFTSLTSTEIDTIRVQINTSGGWEQYPVVEAALHKLLEDPLPAPILNGEQTAYLDSLGKSAWEILFSLLPGWHQSLTELIEVVTSSVNK